jgi:hypothetical protein
MILCGARGRVRGSHRLSECHRERQAEQGDDPNEHRRADGVLEQAIEAIRSTEFSDVIRFRWTHHSISLPKSNGAQNRKQRL